MSHFTVLVPAKDEEDLERVLTPYYEYGCSREMDKKVQPYLVFVDMEDECRKKYENETSTRVKMPDGQLLYPWDEIFRVQNTFGFGVGAEGCTTHKVPEVFPQVEVPFKELFTFEEFCTEYEGYEKDGQIERYGYWHNPNGKWDWFAVGGRWTGAFILKPIYIGAGENGHPGLLTDENDDLSRCDIAEAGWVDWDAILAEDIRRAEENWDNFAEVLALAEVTPERFFALDDEGMRAVWGKIDRSSVDHKRLIDATFFEPLGATREEHVAKASVRAHSFAFVDLEGHWVERGEMGAFANVSNENADYDEAWWAFVRSLPAEQTVYMVDCHI